MKVVIASDIHGSEYYMNRLKLRFDAEGAEQLIILGDLYYHGPRNPLPEGYMPAKVAEILNAMSDKLICLKGNCDSEVDEMISKFQFTESAQIFLNNKKVYLTHGHKLQIESLESNSDIVIYGHLHTGFIMKKDNIILANTGSVSLPKNETKNSYIVLTDEKIELKDLDGNIIESEEI